MNRGSPDNPSAAAIGGLRANALSLSGGSLVGRFFQWWGGELAALVPGRLKRILHPSRPALLAHAEGQTICLEQDTRDQRDELENLQDLPPRALQRFQRQQRKKRLDVVLVAPPGRYVTRSVSFPLTAERDLSGILDYEIERLTPFSASELYYDVKVVERDREAGRLTADLVFVRRADFADAVTALQQSGLAVDRLDVEAPEGILRRLNLLPKTVKRSGGFGRGLAIVLICSLVCLTLAWAGLNLVQKEQRFEELSDALFQVRRAAIAMQDGGQSVAPDDAVAFAAYRLKQDRMMVSEVVALVTELLPDGTWLDRLSIDNEIVEMSGYSGNAAALIDRFETHPAFLEPIFRSPITRENGRERFALAIRIAPLREATE